MKRFPKDRVFGDHSQAQVFQWISTLQYFLFFRAFGGHANDGDYFQMRIKLLHPNDYDIFRKALHLPNHAWNEPTKVWLPHPFHFFHCWIGDREIRVSLVGIGDNPYQMNDREYELCREFENLIDSIQFQNNVSFEDKNNPTCITLEAYGDYFE